jgi:hypothetical protein
MTVKNDERSRRWRLLLGAASEGADAGEGGEGVGLQSLSGDDAAIDRSLQALYNPSAPRVLAPLPECRTLARRHSQILPDLSCAGHAEGRAQSSRSETNAL